MAIQDLNQELRHYQLARQNFGLGGHAWIPRLRRVRLTLNI